MGATILEVFVGFRISGVGPCEVQDIARRALCGLGYSV